MKIALVTGEYPPMEGGVGAFTRELAQAMHGLKHNIAIITSRDAAPQAKRPLPGRPAEEIDLGYARLFAAIDRWRWPSVAAIADLALRNEFDVVNIQYQAAAYNMNSAAINLLPWRLKHLTRTIVTYHDLRTPYIFPKAGPIREMAVSFMARQAGGVISTNHADYSHLGEMVSNPLAFIPIGSNISAYYANHIELREAYEDLGLREGDVLLAYFGFLNESKGADVLIQALAALPQNYHLVFIGGQTGSSDSANREFLDKVQRTIADLKLSERVHWTGFISDKRVSTFLRAADLVVLPYRDGVSLRRGTLMAALAHGCAIVSTSPPEEAPDFVQGENIWLVPAGDAAPLAEAIELLAIDEERRMRLGNGAEQTASLFSWDEIARKTVEFYRNVEDPRTRGAPRG